MKTKEKGQGMKGLFAFPLLCFVILAGPGLARAQGRTVRVGVYNLPPLMEVKNGEKTPAGPLVELFDWIAQQEGWTVTYVPAPLPKGISGVENGSLDLLLGVPLRDDLKSHLVYSRETIFSTWAQIYTRNGSKLQSLTDLAGKTVGIATGSPYFGEFRAVLRKFDVDCEVVEFSDEKSLIQGLENRWVQAGVLDRLQARMVTRSERLVETGIVFSPIELRVASTERGADLLKAVDYHLHLLKKNRNSIYHHLIARVFAEGETPFIPVYLKWAISIGLGVLLLLGGTTLLLREAVRKKTAQLTLQVRYQDALLRISRQVQRLSRSSERQDVLRVCFEEFRNLDLDLDVLSILSFLDKENGRFDFFSMFPDGRTETGVLTSTAWARVHDGGEVAYRSGSENRSAGLQKQDWEVFERAPLNAADSLLLVPNATGFLVLGCSKACVCHEPQIRFTRQIAQTMSLGISRVQEMEYLAEIMRLLPEGVCLFGPNKSLVLANRTGEEYSGILGLKRGRGTRSSNGVPGPFQDFCRHLEAHAPFEMEMTVPGSRTFEIQGCPLVQDLRGSNWIVVIRDVTKERETQARVQEQDRLASIGQLAAGIAHDFRNILTAIMGTAEIISVKYNLPEGMSRELDTIITQGDRAAQLIRQVLDFSRINPVERRPVNLSSFVKEALKLLDRTLPETIAVRASIKENALLVNGNLTQLQQVLNNLAVNAMDAMPEGGTLQVSLTRFTLGAGVPSPLPGMFGDKWVLWTVKDTGAGMPPGVLKRIFEPFFTTKEVGKGTGLGLSQVYGIVKQHDGHIDVKSTPGQGTTFQIYLPGMEASSLDSGMEIPESEKKDGKGETVLVVEDEALVLEVADQMLDALGYRVVSAKDGKEALEVYRKKRVEIDLVITDIVMPRMGGLELFRALLDIDPDVRVILMSGYVPKDEKSDALVRQAADFIEKPLSFRKLSATVQAVLGPEKRRPASTGTG